jgi:hypothetical protein
MQYNDRKTCDRAMRHPTAKLIKEAIAEDLMIRRIEELTGTVVDEALDTEVSFIGFPFPCPHNTQVNLIDRLRLVSYKGSIFQFRDVVEWDGSKENQTTDQTARHPLEPSL